MTQEPCSTLQISRTLRLWWEIPAEAQGAEYFMVQAAPGNSDVISLNGSLLAPGERNLLHRDAMMKATVCAPDPASTVQVWAVPG